MVKKKIHFVLTAKDSAYRLTEVDQKLVLVSHAAIIDVNIEVDEDVHYQTILGFGGGISEAVGYNFNNLSPDLKTKLLVDYFDENYGIGYKFCRTHINSCDFALGNYSYAEVSGDLDLEHFSIERDMHYLIPVIKEVKKIVGDQLKILASVWSPPGWMKNTGRMNFGGKLLPEYYDVWARYLVRYVREYEKEGLPIWGMTVQSEPQRRMLWESCTYSPREEREFIGGFLGPALEKAGLGDVKIICCDENRDEVYDRAKTIYKDTQAFKYIWGVGYHWYCHGGFDDLNSLHEEYPDKNIIFTEGSIIGGSHNGSWNLGERYAESIIGDLSSWSVGWIDWNILLDENGGPNHVSNFCSAPVLASKQGVDLFYQNSFYYIGHFSKFIKPSAKRVSTKLDNYKVQAVSFKNTDGSLVCVVLNRKNRDVVFNLKCSDLLMNLRIPARGIMTIVY